MQQVPQHEIVAEDEDTGKLQSEEVGKVGGVGGVGGDEDTDIVAEHHQDDIVAEHHQDN